MTRLAVLALLVACSGPAPINAVCARVALASPTAQCQPELTDVGEHHTHTAIVTLEGKPSACAINDQAVRSYAGRSSRRRRRASSQRRGSDALPLRPAGPASR